jgi:hypothetical protein
MADTAYIQQTDPMALAAVALGMPPGRVKITAGTHAIRCPRLSNKVLRWYTECCRTPTANTAARLRFPVKLAEEALDAALTSYVSRSVADFALA